jgi:hypothetical protein
VLAYSFYRCKNGNQVLDPRDRWGRRIFYFVILFFHSERGTKAWQEEEAYVQA